MIINNLKKVGLILVIISTLFSCGIAAISKSGAEEAFTIEKRNIPEDFSANKKLLLLKNRGYYKSLIKNVDKYFKGGYKEVEGTSFNLKDLSKELINEYKEIPYKDKHERDKFLIRSNLASLKKYNDIEKYRFVLTYRTNGEFVSNDGSSWHMQVACPQYLIYDRKKDEIYYAGRTSSAYNKILKYYILELNKYL
jgi:hypothetical protein